VHKLCPEADPPCLRQNSDLRKLGVNMVPFPRLHFFSCGFAPLVAPGGRAYQQVSVPELVQQMFDPKNIMAAIDPRRECSRRRSALARAERACISRQVPHGLRHLPRQGETWRRQQPLAQRADPRPLQVSSRDAERELQAVQTKNASQFVEWIPQVRVRARASPLPLLTCLLAQCVSTSLCDVAPPGLRMSATFIGNTT
jgi:tubulin beta